MGKVKFHFDLVDVNEYMSLILQCLSSEEYKDAVEDKSADYREGAMWGMAFAAMYANTHATHYGALGVDEATPPQYLDIPLHYPCVHCGSCPVWLAAYEVAELSTHSEVVEACRARGCDLIGKPVPKELLK